MSSAARRWGGACLQLANLALGPGLELLGLRELFAERLLERVGLDADVDESCFELRLVLLQTRDHVLAPLEVGHRLREREL